MQADPAASVDDGFDMLAYILKASDVAVMAILAKKNWRKICLNFPKFS